MKRVVPHQLSLALLSLMLWVAAAFAQSDSICSFDWNQSTDCALNLGDCFDSTTYAGKTIRVPANVTHIGKTGLQLCVNDVNVGNPADIVYAVDMTWSMFDKMGAGDYKFARASAVKAGIQYQIDSAQASSFGYIGFVDTIVTKTSFAGTYPYCHYVGSTQLSPVPAGFTQSTVYNLLTGKEDAYKVVKNVWDPLSGNHLFDLMRINADVPAAQNALNTIYSRLNHDQHLGLTHPKPRETPTNFYVALSKARQMLFSKDSTHDKIIIFIADGNDTKDEAKRAAIIDSLKNKDVRVYTVLLGNTSSKADTLKKMASLTGGDYYHVSNPDSLASVLGSIVKKVISFQFESITVKANGTTVNAGADPVEVSDGRFQLVLNNILPLKPGLNDISFDARFRSSDPATQGKAIKFDFKINVSGPVNPNCYTCRPRSKLEVLDTKGAKIDSLTWQNDSVVVRLTYYAQEPVSSAHAFITSTKTGDQERFNNPPIKNGTSPWVYEKRIPFRLLQNGESSLAGRIDASGINDTVRVSWSHPVDSLDRGTIAIPVIAPPNRVMIYDALGSPALTTVNPYAVPPAQDTFQAGSVVNLYAKALSNSQWLAAYEQQTALKNSFSWTVSNASVGSLNKTTGNYVQYSPKIARQSVDITVTLNAGQGAIDTTIRFYIVPGPKAKISIEDNPLGGRPITNLTIGPDATIATPATYAVYRDLNDNYVGSVDDAQWVSLNTSVATAASGSGPGQGVVSRVDSAGSADIIATDGIFYDTVTVTISKYTYTAIKISAGPVIADSIKSLNLKTDSDTTRLYALGKRSDNGVWELLIGAGWGATGVSLAPAAPQGSASWSFVAKAKGSGLISTSFSSGETNLSDIIPVRIDHSDPDTMLLYTAEGNPFTVDTVRRYGSDTTIAAGRVLPIVAKLFNNLGEWIAEGESVDSLRQRITWELVNIPGKASLTNSVGHKTAFTAEDAYKSYVVKATYTYLGRQIVQQLAIEVGVGDIVRLVIEGTSDVAQYRNDANPLDTLTIDSRDTTGSVYAVLRDQFDNFVSFATQAVWQSADTAIVTIVAGDASIGEGVVTRAPSIESGITTVSATQAGFSDNVVVDVRAFYYDMLRIEDRTASGNEEIDTLRMNTNQTDTLFAYGRRSNDATKWDAIAVTWQSSPSLQGSIPSTLSGKFFILSPTAPASGGLRVTLGNDAVTEPDIVQLIITAGPATKLTLLGPTPVDSLIAGRPVQIDLVLENDDGLLPGDSCYTAVFTDLLSGGSPNFPPKVIVPSSKDTVALGEGVELCFTNGRSVIDVILYNAPADKSPHIIKAVLDNRPELTAQTAPFVLKPGPLTRLDIVSRQGSNYVPVEAVRLSYPGRYVELFTQGFDQYGNLRVLDGYNGLEPSDWVTTGSIPAGVEDSSSRFFYDGTRISDFGSGHIIASAPNNAAIRDSVKVDVTGPDALLISALTRDTSGNGYLDRVEVHFNDTVNATQASLLTALRISEFGSSRSFVNASIIGANGTMVDSVFYLNIVEQPQGNPQTAMLLTVAVTNAAGVTDGSVKSLDGAGPVIWRVIKRQKDAKSLSDDEVTVEFSEPVQTRGGQIDLGMSPGGFLQVWEKTGGVMEERPGFLVGIPGLITPNSITNEFGGTVIAFRMQYASNEDGVVPQRDLMSRNYLTIDSLASLIVDGSQNPAMLNNRKVQVVVIGDPSDPISYPNPTRYTFRRIPPLGTIWGHQPGAVQWVGTDGAGTVTSITVPLPLQPDGTSGPGPNKIELFMKIYDVAGNLVDGGSNRDLVQQYMDSEGIKELAGSSINIDFYWNGSNGSGMPVSPGAYRVFFYLNYTSPNQKDIKKASTIGIGY